VGRPDLSARHTPVQLAGLLYDSLHSQLLTLPDSVLVYPAHGAGSLCGKNMRAERSSTISTERLTNYALQIKSREEFVAQLTSNLPARPEYFLKDAEINRTGAAPLSELPRLRAIAPAELKAMLSAGEIALDVRANDEFAAGHVPGSVNIALGGQFASWAGTVLGLSAHPVLIAGSEAQLEEARLRLTRVGIEALDGYLAGGVAAWKQADLPVATISQMTAGELDARLKSHAVQVLDVRREPEWDAGHIEGATWWPLDNFKVSPPEMDHEAPIAVHCKGGYRSMIASSLLQRAGFKNVINVVGGFDAWQQAKLPTVSAKPVGV
jgi:hydroxyacylglutathione hydrolase